MAIGKKDLEDLEYKITSAMRKVISEEVAKIITSLQKEVTDLRTEVNELKSSTLTEQEIDIKIIGEAAAQEKKRRELYYSGAPMETVVDTINRILGYEGEIRFKRSFKQR